MKKKLVVAAVIINGDELSELLYPYRHTLEHEGMTIRDVIELTVTGWVEFVCPKRYPPNLTSAEVLSAVVEDSRPRDDQRYIDYLYAITELAYFMVDERMSQAIHYHGLVGAEFGGFLGSDGVIVKLTGNDVLRLR